MLTERNLWLGATAAVVSILLMLLLRQPSLERHGRSAGHLTDLGVIVSIDGGQTWRVTPR
jgi:hypothetical protein